MFQALHTYLFPTPVYEKGIFAVEKGVQEVVVEFILFRVLAFGTEVKDGVSTAKLAFRLVVAAICPFVDQRLLCWQ